MLIALQPPNSFQPFMTRIQSISTSLNWTLMNDVDSAHSETIKLRSHKKSGRNHTSKNSLRKCIAINHDVAVHGVLFSISSSFPFEMELFVSILINLFIIYRHIFINTHRVHITMCPG